MLRDAPAARAGLLAGDAVVSVDGKPVTRAQEIVDRVRASRPGTRLALVIRRGERILPLPITLEALPDLEAYMRRTLLDHPAPDFTGKLVAGSYPAHLAELGGHVVVVDFWATWCRPCAVTMPALDAWQAKYGPRGLRIVGLSGEDEDVVKSFLSDHQLGYTIALDANSEIAATYLQQGLPTLVVIDKAGVVRHVQVGAGDFDALEAAIVRLL